MESDKKLDKLETFLGRLNSKGTFLFFFGLAGDHFFTCP